jgi:hypothetical protein
LRGGSATKQSGSPFSALVRVPFKVIGFIGPQKASLAYPAGKNRVAAVMKLSTLDVMLSAMGSG